MSQTEMVTTSPTAMSTEPCLAVSGGHRRLQPDCQKRTHIERDSRLPSGPSSSDVPVAPSEKDDLPRFSAVVGDAILQRFLAQTNVPPETVSVERVRRPLQRMLGPSSPLHAKPCCRDCAMRGAPLDEAGKTSYVSGGRAPAASRPCGLPLGVELAAPGVLSALA